MMAVVRQKRVADYTTKKNNYVPVYIFAIQDTKFAPSLFQLLLILSIYLSTYSFLKEETADEEKEKKIRLKIFLIHLCHRFLCYFIRQTYSEGAHFYYVRQKRLADTMHHMGKHDELINIFSSKLL